MDTKKIIFVSILIITVNLCVALNSISSIFPGAIAPLFHKLDMVICSDSNFSGIELSRDTFSISVLKMKSCCPLQPGENQKQLLEHPTIVLWLADSGPEVKVNWSHRLSSLFNCVQTRESANHEMFPSSGQPLYNIVLTRPDSHNEIFDYLKNNVTIFLQPPHELLLCSLVPSSCPISCIELYHFESNIRTHSISRIEAAIIELSLRRLNFFRTTIPAVALDMPGYTGERFKPRLKPEDPIEFNRGSIIDRYRYIRDSLNFTERAIVSNSSLSRNKENNTLENTGLAKIINSGMNMWVMGEWEFVDYRLRGKYGLRYLHGSLSKRKPVAVFVQPKDEDDKVYKRPFQTTVWLTLIILTFSILATFVLIVYKSQGQVYRAPSTSIIFSAIWCTVEILLLKVNQATLALYTTSSTARLFACTILLLIFILQGIYTSTLTSIFTINSDKIKTFHQLKENGFELMLSSDAPSLKPLVVYLEQRENFQEEKVRNVFPKVLNSKVALVTGPTEFRTFLPSGFSEEFLCEKLSMITLSRFPIKGAHLLKNRSPYRNAFNIKLLHMFQSGNEERIQREATEKASLICPSREAVSFYSMSIHDTKLVFIFLLSAACLSLVLLLVERLLIQKPNDS